MRRTALAAAIVLAFGHVAPALAQVAVSPDTLTHVDPSAQMPAGKFFVNNATMPGKHIGSNSPQASVACTGRYNVECSSSIAGVDGPGSDGAFRISCATSHYGYDDPIVRPGQPGVTHLHVFFGNNTTSSDTDLNNLPNVGTSTCHGGKFNMSGYWVPAMIYSCPNPDLAPCTGSRNGEIQNSTSNEVYYKTGGVVVSPPVTSMEWPPAKFRMIGGNATSTVLQTRPFFACVSSNGVNNFNWNPARIPVSAEASFGALGFNCDSMTQSVAFRQCWDGVNLDSPDHQSHLAEINKGTQQCDTPGFTAHVFPDISYNVHYNVTVADLDYWRLSSDWAPQRGVTQTSADASHIKVAANVDHGSTANFYQYGMVFIGGVGRQISSWDNVNMIATLVSALPSTPAAATDYEIRAPGGMTNHGDWVNGWDQTTPVAGGSSLPVDQTILVKCLRPLADCHDSALRDADPAHPRDTLSTTWWLLN